MGIHVVKVPDIGEGIAEVELVEWHVRAGDTVIVDQVLADVMTDKATVEVPTPVAGRVLEVRGNVGDKLAVGSELLRIAVEVGERDATHAAPAQPSVAPAGAGVGTAPIGRPLASPSVRRQARELCVDLAQVTGTGPDGRVVHDDVVRHAAGAMATPAGGPDAKAAGVARYAERTGEQRLPLVGLRRQIARRMRETLAIPHFTYVEEIDVTELEALRARMNDLYGGERGHLTLLPFVVRAIVLAVSSYPQMNAHFDEAKEEVTRFAAVHVGIATQTDAGLAVPVVRHAEARDIWSSAAEIARLAGATRSGKAAREELAGSTITITSLGPLGGVVTTPVINPPEVAIVGINRIVLRPTVQSGAIVARKLMNLSSSFDHRIVDGQQAAEFVQAVRGCLECPALLFVDQIASRGSW